MSGKPYLTLSLALAFAVFLVVIIGLADTASLGVLHGAYDLPYGDKAGHFVLNGMLALLVCLAIPQLKPDQANRRMVLLSSLLLLVLVTLEEASKVFIPTRSPDLFDLSASYLGIVSGALAALLLQGRTSGGLNGLAPEPD
jgi:VanZ family protein